MSVDPRIYQIALTLIPGIGDVLAKNLLSYCGSIEAIFQMTKGKLMKVPGVGEWTAQNLVSQDVLRIAEEELAFVDQQGLEMLFFTDENYPWRLKHCADSPILLYYKGTPVLNASRMVAIVGTRNITDYGKLYTEKIVEQLLPFRPVIVSGLAYGVDIMAHRAALRVGLPTVGVVGHGLDMIYPYQHRSVAERMQEQGGLLTEFRRETRPDKENFPKRNRIVAGMIDALIVVESAEKGGALITADIAFSYNKDVFALPGRLTDPYSAGCNWLINQHKAALFSSVDDMVKELRWGVEGGNAVRVPELFLSEDESAVMQALQPAREMPLDELLHRVGWSPSRLSATLLEMEFKGLLAPLPGNRYRLI